MDGIKIWIIPTVAFGFFLFFAVAALFYAYSDTEIPALSNKEVNSSVMSMQDFQEAMDSNLK